MSRVEVPVVYRSQEMTAELLTAMLQNAADSSVGVLTEHRWAFDTPIEVRLLLCPDGRLPEEKA